MAGCRIKMIFIAIILNCSWALARADEAKASVGLNEMTDECEDSESLFSEQLQNNYLDGFLKMSEFFKSTHSVLEKINKKLELLEQANKMQDMALMKLDTEFVNLKIEAYRGTSSPIFEGSSFKGLAVEIIANEVPDSGAVAVQIVNYLDVSLKDYQLHLSDSLQHHNAPTTVQAKTTEIFTFKKYKRKIFSLATIKFDVWSVPAGAFLYEIGESGLSMHLYFDFNNGRHAVGLLGNEASVQTLWPLKDGCSNYNHNGSHNSFRCIREFITYWPSTRTVLIHQDSVYAKVTADFQTKTNILKIEIFKDA